MKYVKLMGIVAVLGLISAVQVKASVALPGEHSLKSSNFVVGHTLQHLGEPLMTPSIPEPSDWAWAPVLGTIGFLAWRRLSRKSAA